MGLGAAIPLGYQAASGEFNQWLYPVDNIIQNIIPEYSEELQWVLLGTGVPQGGNVRARTANAVLAGDKVFLVDCGAEVVMRLIQAGIPPQRIEHLFFTHHHTDHNGGFIDFFTAGLSDRELPKRQVPLHIYGPPGTDEVVNHLLAGIEVDLRSRSIAKEIASPIYQLLEEGVIYDDQGVKVTVFPVDHGNYSRYAVALAYVFEYKGKKMVFSGDAHAQDETYDRLVTYAQNADLLIHESYSPKLLQQAVAQAPALADSIDLIRGAHTPLETAAEIAEKAGVRHLALYHHIPSIQPLTLYERFYAQPSSNIFSGKITMGRDLMVFM